MIKVRPFRATDSDYEILSFSFNGMVTDAPLAASEWRVRDNLHNPQLRLYRVIGELNGEGVGFGEYYQPTWSADPRHIECVVYVHPAYQGRGLGRALWQHLTEAWQDAQPQHIWVKIREDWTTSLAFASRRGFGTERRLWPSRLDLAAFDPTPFRGAIERVCEQQIVVRSFAELINECPAFWEQLYDFECQILSDVPATFPLRAPAFEQWVKFYQPDHGAIWAGSFAAIADSQIVGISTLEELDRSADLEVGFTGVRRDYRGRGIALALKLHTIAYARAIGATGIRTDNDSTNMAMWRINEALGFQRMPTWIVMHRREPDGETQ